jgi:hypothetical protein
MGALRRTGLNKTKPPRGRFTLFQRNRHDVVTEGNQVLLAFDSPAIIA